MTTHKEVYSTVDFGSWAYKQGLLPEEEYLVKTYLNKTGKTVEAGTAGGRIILGMKELGFTSLYGFDYVPEFIAQARENDSSNSINFAVEDATALTYEDEFFDQLVYLQQIICCIDDELGRLKALREAYRTLKPGGVALFSFLSFDVRVNSPTYQPYLAYLRLLRQLRNSNSTIQYLPRIKLGGKLNVNAFLDKQPYMYWYKLEEAYQNLMQAKFQVLGIGSDLQVRQGNLHNSVESLMSEPMQGMLYFVCQK